MKKIIVSIFLIYFISCKPKEEIEIQVEKLDNESKELDNNSRYYDKRYATYTLEGCEYIVVGVGKYQWGSHKGNCKNQIHKK